MNDVKHSTDHTAPNGYEFYLQRTTRGDWGAWEHRADANHSEPKEPVYRHGQLSHLRALIDSEERPLGEAFDESVRTEIHDCFLAIRAIEKQKREIDDETRERKRPLVEQKNALLLGLRTFLGLRLDVDPQNVSLGSHKCSTSPTAQCVYDEADDPLRDYCVFCHNPSERK